MTMMSNRILATTVSAVALVAISAFAVDLSQIEKSIPLKDGSTVYVLKSGKMGMEDKYGRAARMQPGVTMETKDGQRIVMIGDEVMQVSALLNKDNRK
jgi:hypothetical protein